MSDIFISYARSTEREAKAIGEALRALGYGVWRDDEIPAHRAYADVISERLKAAKAVLVIWSAEAAGSAWVRSEAEKARSESKLVQLNLDGAELPMPFDQIQCADLSGWTGQDDHPGWRKVTGSIGDLLGAHLQPAPAAKAAPRKLSICVLPFANISDDPQQEYFSDGISEDIITDLSKVSALNVASRNSAFTFKGKSVEVPEVGRKLGVSYVLEGSVRKAGDRVRITAQLLEAASDTHVWAERWDRDLTDIFALQDEISQAIVAALKLKLLPQEKKALEKRGTANAEAYDLCLMARNLYDTGNYTAENQERIIRFIDRSLAIDPNYALAWALKARAQSALVRKFGRAGDDGAAAAERALELDPNLAEAHAVKARRLHTEGDGEAALAELELALRLDPDSPYVRFTAGTIHYQNRRFDLAAAAYEAAVKLDDSMIDPAFMLYSAYLALGDRERARAAATFALARVEKVLEHDRANGDAMAAGVGALMVLGEVDRAREWMKRALLLDPDNPSMHYNFACALSRDLGDADGALELLTVALAKDKDPTGDNLRVALTDPDLDPIRGDPRFQALLTKTEARLAKA